MGILMMNKSGGFITTIQNITVAVGSMPNANLSRAIYPKDTIAGLTEKSSSITVYQSTTSKIIDEKPSKTEILSNTVYNKTKDDKTPQSYQSTASKIIDEKSSLAKNLTNTV